MSAGAAPGTTTHVHGPRASAPDVAGPEPRRAPARRAVLVGVIAFAALVVGTNTFSDAIPFDRTTVSDLVPLPLEAAAAALAFLAGRALGFGSREGRAWRLIGGALACYLAADVAWAILELVLGQPSPFPSVADVGYTLYYPLMLAGLLGFAGGFPDRRDLAAFALDAAVILIATTLIVWDVLLKPALGGEADTLTTALSMFYPLADDVLIVGLLAAAFAPTDSRSHGALRLLVVGLAVIVAADVVFGYLAAEDLYVPGNLADTLYAAWWCIAAVAAWVQQRDAAVDGRPARSPVWEEASGRIVSLGLACMIPAIVIGVDVAGDNNATDVPLVLAAWVAIVVLVGIRARLLMLKVASADAELRVVAAHARDMLLRLRVQPSLAVEYVNAASTDLLGITPDELRADPSILYRLLRPGDDPPGDPLTADRHAPNRARWVRPDGTVAWIEHRTGMEIDGTGGVYLEGVARDVTAQVLAEQSRRESDERLRSIVTSAPVMFVSTDASGVVQVLEGQAIAGTGLDPVTGVGTTVESLFRGAPELAADVREALAGATFTATRRVGGVVLECRHAPVRGEGAAVTGAVLVATDVTERDEAERARALLSSVVEQATESVVVTDGRGVIVYVNAAFTQMTGYTADEAIGQRPDFLAVPDPGQTVPSPTALFLSDEPASVRMWQVRKDGSRCEVERITAPVRDASGDVAYHVGMARDVTHERELEAQLEQAQKMEAVGRLAGGLAHDFNNLLTVVSGYASILEQGLAHDEESLADIQEIGRAAERAASLTRQLLAFGRRAVMQPRVVDVGQLMTDVGRMLQRLLGEDVVLSIVVPDGLGRVIADPGQVEQVLVNLAVNARDAMPDGGNLTLEAADVEVDETLARRTPVMKPGRYVRISVSDTGVGMDRETRLHAFEPFFTTKSPGAGTGLGLATVYGIVTQSGGTVAIDSTPAVGTTITIHLPRATEDVAEARPAPLHVQRSADGTETVFVVEDDPAVRSFIVLTLSRHGYRVIEAADATQALGRLAESGGAVDLMITDVVMPGANGPDLAQRARSLYPSLPVLFISGYPREALGERNIIDSSVAFLQKPFTPAALAERVRSMLDEAPAVAAEDAAAG